MSTSPHHALTLPPVIAAPMAGGPSTPALANAVDFGFLALGTCSLKEAEDQLAQVNAPYGVNLFYPQADEPQLSDINAVAKELSVDVPSVDLTNGFAQKFALILSLDNPPAVVSSTFGCFTVGEIDALHERGIEAWVTVTNPRDAEIASRRGADRLVVQGPEAGGHRSTWSIFEEPDQRPLAQLLSAVQEVSELPLIAAGGARTSEDVADLIARGAQSVACGSAFLLADEAGTSQFNRELLEAGGSSISTRAFSGRYARGMETEFTRTHEDMAALYPYLNAMLKPRRAEQEYAYCLVGIDPERIHVGAASQLQETLLP
ncbi:nitronate monooxygenase [Corynebacterium breve]|uniref:Propionate 3-nitronate monooxygenase n=1 Tax=Corynebacterium breve TaxID=3049799 RepID=A0ABY8VGM3_9CORY|nr:nitronate monooxygenase [Corynebacterium breve]WIM68472.1 nitronate monooxygenase [Corynebacterium breve]